MKSSQLALFYVSQVLGVTSYLCPQPLYKRRSLKGGFPHPVAVIVFCPPSVAQKLLLKKIFASVEVFSFSLLVIKKETLNTFSSKNFVGLKGLFIFESQKEALGFGSNTHSPSIPSSSESQKKALGFQSNTHLTNSGKAIKSSPKALLRSKDSSPPPLTESKRGNLYRAPSWPLLKTDFTQLCFFCGPLSDYEGSSPTVIKRKQELWIRLKSWKKLSY